MLNNLVNEAAPSLSSPSSSSRRQAAANRAIAFMKENLGTSGITLEDIARAAIYSKFHLNRIFVEAVGSSVRRYLAQLRIEAAQHLLLTTDLTVAEITDRVGYRSVGSFAVIFKKLVGIPPSEYRRHARASSGSNSNGTL